MMRSLKMMNDQVSRDLNFRVMFESVDEKIWEHRCSKIIYECA